MCQCLSPNFFAEYATACVQLELFRARVGNATKMQAHPRSVSILTPGKAGVVADLDASRSLTAYSPLAAYECVRVSSP